MARRVNPDRSPEQNDERTSLGQAAEPSGGGSEVPPVYPRRTATKLQPLRGEVVGTPQRLGALAQLLLQLHREGLAKLALEDLESKEGERRNGG